MDIEKLERLQKLKENGALTEEEFLKEKEKLINENINQANNNTTQNQSHKGKFKCPKCKNYIGKYVERCPICGWKNWYYKQPSSSNGSVGCIGALIVVIIIYFVGSELLSTPNYNTNNSNYTNQVSSNTNSTNYDTNNDLEKFDAEETLENLEKELKNNSARLQNNLYGKRVKITGTIHSIGNEENGVLGVLFEAVQNNGTAKASWVKITLKNGNINCYAIFDFKDGNSSGYKNYNVGDKITLIGKLKFVGGNTLGFYESKIIE